METGLSPARTYADPALSRARRFARYVRVNPSLPSQRAVLTIAFLSFALPLCILLALLTPPGQVADEPAHSMRAYALLHGQIIGHRVTDLHSEDGISRPGAGVEVDAALGALSNLLVRPDPKLDRTILERAWSLQWSGTRVFYELSPIAIYAPVFYLPAAFGLGVAKLAGAGPMAAFLAGRLASVLAFAAMAIAALFSARRGLGLLFCILCFPMTLSLAASFNQDGLIIGASVLAAALLTRAEEPGARGSYGWAAVLIGCIVAVKPPYVPLCAMLMLPLPRLSAWTAHAGIFIRRAGIIALAVLPGLVWAAVALRYVSAPSTRALYHPGPLWPGDPSAIFVGTNPVAQLSVLLADPTRLVTLPWNTITHDPWIITTAIGVFGWLALVFPAAFYALWKGAVAAACLSGAFTADRARLPPRWPETVLLLLAASACVLGVYLSQYLVWTNVGSARIDGPQGRYWLPILPLLALAIPQFKVPGGLALRAVCTLPLLVAAAAGLVLLPPMIVAFFYLR